MKVKDVRQDLLAEYKKLDECKREYAAEYAEVARAKIEIIHMLVKLSPIPGDADIEDLPGSYAGRME